MELFRLFGSIMIDDKQALDALKKVDKETRNNKKAFDDVTTAIAKTTAAVGLMATAIGGKAIHSAVEFEKQMANVGTLLDGDVKGKMISLGDNVKTISKEMGISTSVLTDGLYQVVSALGDSEDSMKILEVASKGASAGGATVTDAVNLLSAVTKGYGDTSVEAASKASDLAFMTVKLGQTSFPELASSMGRVIPLASTMKVSQEELFGAMATLTGVTGGTAEVTTQLRSTIQGFLQPTKKMEDALKKMGFANGQVAIESEGLGGILDKLKDSVNGNELEFSSFFSSVEAKNAVLALTGAQADTFREKTEAMNGAVGATTAAFDVQQDTVGVTFDKLRAKADVFLIDLGQKLLPTLEKVLDWFMEKMPAIEEFVTNAMNGISGAIAWVVDNANWLIPVLTTLIGTFVALKVIGAVSFALGILKGAMVKVTTAGGIMNAVLALNPAVLIAVGIGVLIGAIVALIMNFDKVKEAATSLWNVVKDTFGKMRDWVKNVFDSIAKAIKLPKLEITGKFSLLPPSVPKFNVKWNADGGIFSKPTIFDTSAGYQGVGEAGPEAIMPLSKLQDLLDFNKSELDENKLAKAIRKELDGFAVVLNGQRVGEFVDTRIYKGLKGAI